MQKPWKVHVNIIVSPVTLTDVHDHLYWYGGLSPIGGCQNGATGNTPNNPIAREIQFEIDPGVANHPWFLYVCNSHFEEDNLNHHPLINEVFPATQGLTQLTTLLCSIIMSSVHDNIFRYTRSVTYRNIVYLVHVV